jgi:Flp pilus assembly protein TadB
VAHLRLNVSQGCLCLLAAVGLIIFAVAYRSAFSIVYAAVATVLVVISILRSRKISEKEMIRRQNEALAAMTAKDDKSDPREMARWIP